MGSVFTAIAVTAASSAPADCGIGSYFVISDSNQVSMSSSGTFSIGTSVAFVSTITVKIQVGSQTRVSSSFSAEVYDCSQHMMPIFQNL